MQYLFRTLVLLFLAACADGSIERGPVTVWLDPAAAPEGPYPSDFYTVPDLTTRTGVRINFSAARPESLPLRALFYDEGEFRPHRSDVESLDGFSGFAPIFVPFSAALATDTVTPAAFALVDLEEGELLPAATEYYPDGAAWVVVRPRKVMRAAHRHALLIRDRLRDATGRRLTPAAEWAMPDNDRKLATKIAGGGEFLGGFTFTVQDTTGEVISIAEAIPSQVSLAITGVTRPDVRTIEGYFRAPQYRSTDGLIHTFSAPVPVTYESVRFMLKLPRNHTTAPRPYPVAIWGHGLTGDRDSIPDVDDGAVIAIDAVEHGARQTIAVRDLVAFKFFDFFHLLRTRENLRQTQIDNISLAYLLTGLDAQLQAALGEPALIDGVKIGYLGASLGAIVGGVSAPLAANVDTMVMIVGGAGLSQAFRYGLFGLLSPNAVYFHTPIEREMFFAHIQTIFDRADAVNYLRHAVHEPLPGHDPRNFLFDYVIGDRLVPNQANETYYWAGGLEILAPVHQNSFGVPVLPGPTAAGNVTVNGVRRTAVAFQYNPPETEEESKKTGRPIVKPLDRHGYMADVEGATRQIEHFFLSSLRNGYGEVIQAE